MTVGEPALADEFTGRHFRVMLSTTRMVVFVVLFAVVLVSAEVLSMVDVMPDLPLTFTLTTVSVIVVVTIFPWKMRAALVPGALGTWRAAPARLLAEQSWRETQAMVLTTSLTTLALPGGECVRVSGLPRAAREVVSDPGRAGVARRTGRQGTAGRSGRRSVHAVASTAGAVADRLARGAHW